MGIWLEQMLGLVIGMLWAGYLRQVYIPLFPLEISEGKEEIYIP